MPRSPNPNPDPLRKARGRYRDNRGRQRKLGVEWKITFEEWYNWFLSHGIDKNQPAQPSGPDSLCVTRINERKPFELDNIRLAVRGASERYPDLTTINLNKPKPKMWKVKDPYLHSMYEPWLRQKAQANYRGEDWDLTFDDFASVWGQDFPRRGRASTDLTMTRIDPEKAWTLTNVEIVTRNEQLKRAQQIRNARKL